MKWLAWVGAVAASLLLALFQRERAQHAGTRAERAEDNAKTARRQTEALHRANEASSEAADRGKGETDEAVERARRGDFSRLDSDW